jgi:lipopolysaccharide biosynthesis glycosyltransferase
LIWKKKLKEIKKFEINFIEIDLDNFKNCYISDNSHFSPANYFRLKLASLLPDINKVIYLDSDTIVIKDMVDFWNISFDNSYIIGCKSMVHERNCKRLGLRENAPYINSGVMMMNLKMIRRDNIENVFFDCIKRNPEIMQNVDQDVINLALLETENSIKQISQKWNTEIRTDTPFTKKYLPIVDDPYIIHYLTGEKPWQKESKQLYKEEFIKYNKIFNKINKKNFLKKIIIFSKKYVHRKTT